jgi:UDP-N-acetylmuramoylalanine-D-glutamate ligase
LELSEEIWLFFWEKELEDLNSTLNDISSIKIKDWCWHESELSRKLQKNLLQTIEYMYSHKIITGDSLRKFLKLQNTMQIVACNRVVDFINDSKRFRK